MSEPAEEAKAAPETKAQLVQYIKSWIESDNDIRDLQKELKTLRENKSTFNIVQSRNETSTTDQQ